MIPAILKITNGTESVDLLSDIGINVQEYTTGMPVMKDGGIWVDNMLVHGRKPYMVRWTNIIDTLVFNVTSKCTDTTIEKLRKLVLLLNQAHEYFTTQWNNTPVWIEARAHNESATRYAIIFGFEFEEIEGVYSPEFASRLASTLQELTLVIEHGYWQSGQPGFSQAVGIFSQSYGGKINYLSVPIVHDDDDQQLSINLGNPGVVVPAWKEIIEVNVRDDMWNPKLIMHGALSFVVNVPQGSRIINFRLKVFGMPCGDIDAYMHVFVENSPTPLGIAGMTYDQIVNRSWTIAGNFKAWQWNYVSYYYTPDMDRFIQPIIDDPAWVAGNRMNFWVYPQLRLIAPESGMVFPYAQFLSQFASHENNFYKPPALEIEYISSASNVNLRGQEETTQPDVYIVNRQNKATISHAVRYDAAAVGYVSLYANPLPVKYFGDPFVTVGDCLYLGIIFPADYYGTFSNVVFDSTGLTPGDSMTYVWEYWDGAAWSALSVFATMDKTPMLDEGVFAINFIPPADWAHRIVDGNDGYWIRARVTATDPFIDSPAQRNRHIYTAILPHAEIEADEIKGDIPATMKFVVTPKSDETPLVNNLGFHRCIIASRSMERGKLFEPFIPFSQPQLPYGVQTVPTIGFGAFASPYLDSPTDDVYQCHNTITNTWQMPIKFIIDPQTAKEYIGQYRVYLRAHKPAGAGAKDVQFRIYAQLGATGTVNMSTAEDTLKVGVKYQLLELGLINMPLITDYIRANSLSELTIGIEMKCETALQSLNLFDLILMPADEMILDAVDESRNVPATFYEQLEIDGISQLKGRPQAWIRDINGNVKSFYTLMCPDAIWAQANAAQRFYVLTSYFSGMDEISSPWQMNVIQIFKKENYMMLRGAA